jgi:glycosyltransferase involved in cell wall biosynthesis
MNQKKKILLLSDHPLSTSGVGTQARWLIHGLVDTGRYTFRCLGAALKHSSYETSQSGPDIIIKPIDGFGDVTLMRQLVAMERPDAVMLFTDPRFFPHIWFAEDEIHQVCPIVYWHLWDNGPAPIFNDYVYESCDLVNCINYPTYEMAKPRFPTKTNYVPHAVPPDLFKPLSAIQVDPFKRRLLGQDRMDHFTVLYVSRNAKRKMTPDILLAFKLFLDDLQKKHGHKKATIVMHADPLDPEGAPLHAVIDMLGIGSNVVFSNDRVDFNQMALLYNSCDVLVNRSSAEGFGLPVLEMKMCGKPVIALKTGGLTRQVECHETGEQFGVALEPEVKSLIGNHQVPFIYDDLVSNETVSKAYMTMYEMGHEKRVEIGRRARDHAIKNYSIDYMIETWDKTLMDTIENWQSRRKPWHHVEI